VQLPQAAEPKGQKDQYFKWQNFILCPQQILNF
jgi:hypothetical protein